MQARRTRHGRRPADPPPRQADEASDCDATGRARRALSAEPHVRRILVRCRKSLRSEQARATDRQDYLALRPPDLPNLPPSIDQYFDELIDKASRESFPARRSRIPRWRERAYRGVGPSPIPGARSGIGVRDPHRCWYRLIAPSEGAVEHLAEVGPRGGPRCWPTAT